jgi:hypothetical protein
VGARPEWRDTVAERWHQYRQVWSAVTRVPPLGTLDDALSKNAGS